MTNSDGSAKNRQWLGNYGEKVAIAFLRSKGASVLRRNFRAARGGEVDIIARHGKLLLFVEVKTRKEGSKIRGWDAVNRKKQVLIERGANAWLRKLGTRQILWRFDVLEVTVSDGSKPEMNWIRNAF